MIDGKKIRKLREDKGWSLRVLAAQVSDADGHTCTHAAIQAVEQTGRGVGLDRLIIIAQLLGVTLDDLVRPS